MKAFGSLFVRKTFQGALLCVFTTLSWQGSELACSAAEDTGNNEPVSRSQVSDAISAGLPFLLEDGFGWLNGEIEYQDGSGCVSCHQVPSGVWAMTAASRALATPIDERASDLLLEATDFISDAATGRPASWGQLLIAHANAMAIEETGDAAPELPAQLAEWPNHLLDYQEEDGRWRAAGQFPSQLRPIEESDAVVTIWVLLGLESAEIELDDQQQEMVDRANQFIDQSSGVTTEWIACRAMLSSYSDAATNTYFDQLIEAQNDDGGFGWKPGDSSNAYATGVALWSIARLGQAAHASSASDAVQYLIEEQQDDGTWHVPSRLVTKKESPDRNYVYRYWATAWATIALATAMESDTMIASDK